ncbi:MAG: type I restriction enzyme HsdR N-terminal domain-containing protein [Odoribacter sp.]
MMDLTLPAFDYKVKKQSGTTMVFDIIRKKYVVITPEEWVRQHLIHYLVHSKNCPTSLIGVEREINLYGLRRRFDLVVYARDGQPWLVVECKSPSVPLTQKVFDQVFRYNMTLDASYVAVTNGIQHYCGRISLDRGFTLIEDFPSFPVIG